MRDELCGCSSVEPLAWAVIGAASNGPVYYQPDPHHLRRLIGWADDEGIPLFYKGNLRPSIPNSRWREDFPEIVPIQARLI